MSYIKLLAKIERKILNNYFKFMDTQSRANDGIQTNELIDIVLKIKMLYGFLLSNSERYLLQKILNELEN
jgi:hypothetical protein